MEASTFKITFILFLGLLARVHSSDNWKSFGNVVEDPSNYLFQGKFIDPENNPLWCAFKDGVGDEDVYRKLGLEEAQVHKIIDLQKRAHWALDTYFKTFLISSYTLEENLESYRQYLFYIQEKYLSDISNILVGADLDVIGSNNWIQANRLKVRGSNNFVFNGKHEYRPIRRNNILRIGRYELSLDKVHLVHQNPFKVIKILGHQ